MDQIAKALMLAAASVKIVDLFPNENPGKGGRDIEDWLTDGGSPDDLRALIEAAPTM